MLVASVCSMEVVSIALRGDGSRCASFSISWMVASSIAAIVYFNSILFITLQMSDVATERRGLMRSEE